MIGSKPNGSCVQSRRPNELDPPTMTVMIKVISMGVKLDLETSIS